MYSASSILGLAHELRPAPLKNTVTVGIDESHHYQYFFEEPISAQNPVHDADSTSQLSDPPGGTTLSWSHTVANQPNRLLVVIAGTRDNSVTACTFNGVPLTKLIQEPGTNSVLSLWYIVAPDTGAHNIQLTFSATDMKAKVGAASFYNVDQTSPLRGATRATATSGSTATITVTSGSTEIVIGAAHNTDAPITLGAGQTQIFNGSNTANDSTCAASYETGAASVVHSYTWTGSEIWSEVVAIIAGVTAGTSSYLYPMRGGRAGTTTCAMEKIDLFNSSFATLETGSHALTNLLKCGQPTRYQSFWWIPDGDEFDPRKLTVASGAVSADTLAASSAWTAGGADHLGNMNGQMIAGLTSNGYAILSVNGTPTTTADWGSYFKAGDKNERPAAISGLSGLSFVLTVEGLFSFNSQARSGLVFEDFRSWRNVFDNIPMPSWRGGLLIPHPTGLLYYSPGELPVNVGFEVNSRSDSCCIVPSGVTELHGGRYMGVHATGDYIWCVYQPMLSSTDALILCGYSRSGNPRDLTWQVVSTTTLQDAQHLLGIFVSAQSQPLSSTYFTPCAWYGDNDDLSYNVLDQRAGPFRSRSDTHAVVTSGDVWLSELFFPEPIPLDRLEVVAQDMAAGDEWQISAVVNDDGEDDNIGAPVIASGRSVLKLGNRFNNVYRVMFHITWVATSASARVPPTLRLMELYGDTNA